MIKTVNEYELSMIKEKLFFLKALKLSKKYNLFEYDNNAEIDFKNNFIDEEDEFECSFINNIKTLYLDGLQDNGYTLNKTESGRNILKMKHHFI